MSSPHQPIDRSMGVSPDHALCWACGEAVPRHPSETDAEYARRKTCGLECALDAQVTGAGQWVEIWADLEAMHVPCSRCGRRFGHEAPHESRRKYVARRTCGDRACVNGQRSEAAQHRHASRQVDEQVDGDLAAVAFASNAFRHDVVDRDASVFSRLSRPDVLTHGGVSASWAVRP